MRLKRSLGTGARVFVTGESIPNKEVSTKEDSPVHKTLRYLSTKKRSNRAQQTLFPGARFIFFFVPFPKGKRGKEFGWLTRIFQSMRL